MNNKQNNSFFHIDTLTIFLKTNQTDEKIVTDLQQLLRSSRWNKQSTVSLGKTRGGNSLS